MVLGEERNDGFGRPTKWTANRRDWFEREQLSEGKPAPKYRASPTEIKAMLIRALAPKGATIRALVA